MSRADLKRELVETGHIVLRAIVRETLSELLETEITMAQFKALAVIDKQPACTIGALSAQLGVKPPAASLLVDKLARAGLAFRLRDVADARRVIVRPTAKGASLVGRVRHGGETVLKRWAESMGHADLAAAARGMRVLAAVAEPVRAGATAVGR